MAIDGGAIGGYWEIGRLRIARPPASIIAIATTQANTGRSRKNLAIGAPLLRGRGRGGGAGAPAHREDPGRTRWSPSTMTLSPAASPSRPATGRRRRVEDELALRDLVVGAHDERVASPRVAGHALLRDHHRVLAHASSTIARTNIPGSRVVRVREDHPEADGAGARVHGDVAELEGSLEGIGAPSSRTSRAVARLAARGNGRSRGPAAGEADRPWTGSRRRRSGRAAG